MAVNLYTQQSSNVRKTWLLMTGSLLLVVGLGWVFAYYFQRSEILVLAVILSIVLNLVAYWQSDKIALSMAGARAIQQSDNPYLFRMVENLSITAGLPMPKLFIIPGAQINALATGRDPQHASIAVTVGALERLENEELEGVLAHELSHIGNRDILISTVVVVLAGVVTIMADWFMRMSFFGGMRGRDNDREGGNGIGLIIALAAAILAPLAATLLQLAISRKREFLADASGALLTRYPDGLANALEKIAVDGNTLPKTSNATAHLYISNPFRAKQAGNWLAKMFSTHPPIQERIAILRGMPAQGRPA